MNKKQISTFFNVTIKLMALVVIIAAILKLNHYPYSSIFMTVAIFIGVTALIIENMYLKKIIKTIDKEKD